MFVLTSIFCRQQKQQQLAHLSGLSTWMTDLSCKSRMFISKGRSTPKHWRLRQSESSAATYTGWPMLFLTAYWKSSKIVLTLIIALIDDLSY